MFLRARDWLCRTTANSDGIAGPSLLASTPPPGPGFTSPGGGGTFISVFSPWLRLPTSSVGFAGPGERYIVAVTYELPASSSLADGVHAVSDLVAMVFGAQTPAPVVIPAA